MLIINNNQYTMNYSKLPIIALFIITGNCGFSQKIMPDEKASIEFISPEMYDVINRGAEIEIIAENCEFTEGPLWVEEENMLLFSDVPANKIYKWTEAGGKEIYLKNGGYTAKTPRGGFMGPNGLYLTKENKLWICQHGDRRIVEMNAPLTEPDTNFITVADSYNGKRLNSPNDLCISSNGDVYFTDPAYGFEKGMKDPFKELSFQGVFKMDKDGHIDLLVDSLSAPNGIALFPDEKSLLLAETQGSKRGWYIYDITEDGLLSNGRLFHKQPDQKEPGGCDGLKINKNGIVFATGPGGIWVFNQSAELIGKIKISDITTANCTLSPDENTIYITATQYVLRVKMR